MRTGAIALEDEDGAVDDVDARGCEARRQGRVARDHDKLVGRARESAQRRRRARLERRVENREPVQRESGLRLRTIGTRARSHVRATRLAALGGGRKRCAPRGTRA